MQRLKLKWLQRHPRKPSNPTPFSDEQIRAKAHEIWLSRNGNAGSSEQDWEAAIASLKAENAPIKRFWRWTGFAEKKGWDFLQLLIVPAVLLIAALSFQQVAKENDQRLADDRAKQDRQLAEDRARQETLSKYLDQMSELLISKGLRKSKPDSEVFILAQARTTTALRGLDTQRQNLIIEFLRSSDLLAPKNRVGILQHTYLESTNLSKAILYGANLINADLYEANLSKASLAVANLSEASLFSANLSNAILYKTNLSKADLYEANLSDANLYKANLKGAINLIQRQLDQAELCRTILPNGEISDRDCKALDIDPSKPK